MDRLEDTWRPKRGQTTLDIRGDILLTFFSSLQQLSIFTWRLLAALKADSEGEVNRADGSRSAGSASVIRTESERERKRERLEEEADDEDLAALCAPPTLSITEEILELINQGRAKEGKVSVEQVLDQPPESQQPPYEGNFTCPLPPVASSPEDRLTLDPQQEEVETRQDIATEEQTVGCQNGLESANVVPERVENRLYAEEEPQGEELEQEVDIRKTREEGEQEKTLTTATPHSPPTELPPSITILEDSVGSSHLLLEKATNSSLNPNDCHQASPSGKPKRGSALTRRDQRIIEKIRSYYEAAAELEEDHEAEHARQEEDETSRRRNSFSQIPTGLVKDSVSRFTSDNQEEAKNEPIETEADHEVEMASPAGPASLVLPEDSHDHDRHADTADKPPRFGGQRQKSP
ncbi:pleckstrin homology domain-containing family G member 3-like [Phycodurus eques]|uniref:pleckstrin homology domain-containing family G member 3-like n=1 Tax=Phycodurus eques TaxID=693459 RepID=UPI002ACD7A5F|nr:pleckstrin homology domain-containing family G member 3-like [Phycodurus eques]